MATYIDSRIISLSAETADIIENDTKLSSCIFYLPALLTDEEDIVYSQISVQSAQIPVSFYTVNIYNNILVFKKGTGPIQTVLFSRGNYNATAFVSEFKQKTGLTLTLNKINGKFTISYSQIFYIFNEGSTCFKIIGLVKGNDYDIFPSLECPFPCQFQGITQLKIISNALATNSIDSTKCCNILATMSVNSAAYGIILYENSSQFKAMLRPRSINYIDIGILDGENNYINFNNVSWTLTFQIDITRILNNMDRTFPKLTNEINIKNTDDTTIPIQAMGGDSDLDFLMYQNNIYQ